MAPDYTRTSRECAMVDSRLLQKPLVKPGKGRWTGPGQGQWPPGLRLTNAPPEPLLGMRLDDNAPWRRGFPGRRSRPKSPGPALPADPGHRLGPALTSPPPPGVSAHLPPLSPLLGQVGRLGRRFPHLCPSLRGQSGMSRRIPWKVPPVISFHLPSSLPWIHP